MISRYRLLAGPLTIILFFSLCFWAGCSLSDGNNTDSNTDPDTSISGDMTGFSDNDELLSYLKDQYIRSVYTDYPVGLESRGEITDISTDGAGFEPERTSDFPSPAPSGNYTGTNLQEIGVDESDMVKTDGDYLYIASDDVLNIVRVSNPLSIVGTIRSESTINALYLYENMLIVLYSPVNYGGIPWIEPGMPDIARIGIPYWIPIQSKIGVSFYDITNPASPNEIKTIEADGYLVSSRRIDNYLYIVQQYLPDLPPPDVLETEIQDMTLEELLPFYETVTPQEDGQKTQLVAAADFYHPEIDGGGSIVTIMCFDLNHPDLPLTSTGVVADASTVYASTQALYFTSSYWNMIRDESEEPLEQTVVYKFDLDDDQVTGQGYTGVDGRVLNQFSLGEFDGVLRIATTTGWSGATDATSENHVFCLRSENGRLEIIGSLRDLAPGEEIYAARFMDTRGYLVTFVTIDPLFTLDLSDPTAPAVAGELKIPGYSGYIHPYGDDYLLCIGKDAVEDDGMAWYQGVQLSIFDISDFSDPVQLHKLVIGDRGTSSDALYTHKAFTFWATNELLAIPIELYEHIRPPEFPYTFGEFKFEGVYVYRVDESSGFDFIGRISTLPDPDDPIYYYNAWTRSVFIEDNIHAITPNAVISAQIDDMEGTVEALFLDGD